MKKKIIIAVLIVVFIVIISAVVISNNDNNNQKYLVNYISNLGYKFDEDGSIYKRIVSNNSLDEYYRDIKSNKDFDRNKETKAGSRQATCFFVCNYREMGMYYYIRNIGRCDCQHLVFTDRYFTGIRYSTIFMDDNVILFYDKTQIFLFCLCRWSFGAGANNCQWVWNNDVSF